MSLVGTPSALLWLEDSVLNADIDEVRVVDKVAS